MSREEKISLALLPLFLLPIAYKAATAGLTHDEAYSFIHYVNRPLREILWFAPHYTANNHVLNTIGIKFFTSFLGSAEWVIRLPNLLAGIFFYLGVRRWFLHFNSGFLMAIPLLVVPYLWDFFALARGYGLALAAWVWLILLVQYNWEKLRPGFEWKFPLLSLLVLWANFSFLPAVLITTGFTGITVFWRMNHVQRIRIIILQTLVFLLILHPLLVLSSGEQLYYGSAGNLWRATFVSLATASYSAGDIPGEYWNWFLMFLAIIGLVAGVVKALARGYLRSAPLLPILLLAGTVAVVYLLHLLFDTPYPYTRTAVYFWPLLALPLASFSGRSKWVPVLPLLFGFGYMAYQSYHPVNYGEWSYDAHTREAYSLYLQERQVGETLEATWLLEPSLNYYRGRLAPGDPSFTRDSITGTAEWLLLLPEDHLKGKGRELVREFPNGLRLIR